MGTVVVLGLSAAFALDRAGVRRSIVCTRTVNPGANLATVESSMSPGQTLCLNSGTYGNAGNGTRATGSDFVYSRAGTAGSPITITSAPGATATIVGNQRIEASYITEEHLNLNDANDLATTPQKAGCTNIPYSTALELDGDGDVLQYDNIYQSTAALRANLIGIGFQEQTNGVDYGHPAGVTIRYDKLSDAGGCSQQDHIIYDAEGSGAQIYDNWIWNDPHGFGIQMYPDSSHTHVYSNVFDGAMGGAIIGDGGGSTWERNVAVNAVDNPQDSSGSGYLVNCFGASSGATAGTDLVIHNASYNNFNGIDNGACRGVSFADNITLSRDPFVSQTTHDYKLNSYGSGQIGSYGLWNGVGPPEPDPAP